MDALVIGLALLFSVAPVAIGLVSGRIVERRHYASIIERERQRGQVLIFSQRLPPPTLPAPDTRLVTGSMVVSIDYFKRFVAGLRSLVGGRLNTHESLLDRARREALLRMREQAAALGATQVFNVKLETAAIAGRASQQGVGSIEVLAYGTALIPSGRR